MPGQPSPPTPRLETRNLTRRFGALVANDHVSLSVRPGELHCLLGENGAGKSTFSACLYGLDQSNEGEIFVNGKAVHIDSPADAIALGIAMVHQHFVLVPAFTVLENIIAGTGSGIALKLAAARYRIGELMVRIGLSLDLDRRVADLSVGECQWVEIVKALYQDVSLLILDEPTGVRTPQESDKLFAILRELKGRGISIILISHKMAEVMQSDRISVLRKGRLVATVETAATTRDELTMMMVGRVVKSVAASARQTDGPPVLSVSDLALPVGAATHPPRVSFDLALAIIIEHAGM